MIMDPLIFVRCNDQKNLPALTQAIEENVGKVLILKNWDDLNQFKTPEKENSYFLVTDIIDASFQVAMKKLSFPLTVVLFTDQPLNELIQWFQPLGIKHLCVKKEAQDPEFKMLLTTLKKRITQDIFGIEKYYKNDIQVTRHLLCQSQERHALKDLLSGFIDQLVSNPKFKQSARVVLEELIMNAFYNAPVDSERNHIYSKRDRALAVELPKEKAVEVSYSFDGKLLSLAVKDAYGSYDDLILVKQLKEYYQENTLTLRKGSGGAGYGLIKVFSNITHLIMNIEKGQYTEIIVLLDLSLRYSKFIKTPSSLNIFIK